MADSVVWMVTVKPDKTADFEAVLAALKDALVEVDQSRCEGAAGRLEDRRRLTRPQPDGNDRLRAHHQPVVKGADYGVMANIYAVVTDPAEQKELYDKYAGSFGANLMQAPLNNVMDFSK